MGLDLRHAAIDEEFDAIYETAVVGGKEHNRFGDFVRDADAAERNGGDLEVHEGLHLLFRQSHQIVARSRHDTRADGVDTNFAFLEVEGPV